jgi:circadian clock protein KaiB
MTNEARLVLRLYVAGSAPNSQRAIANTRAFCDAHFAGGYDLEIVDLLTSHQHAIEDGIIVTPTLIRLRPLPVRRLIGDLSDTSELLLALPGQ